MGSQEFCIDGGSPGASNRLSERGGEDFPS